MSTDEVRGFVTGFAGLVARTRPGAVLWSELRPMFPDGDLYDGDS